MADPFTISAFIASWFTPSSLFLFLNLVIGTIVLSSRFGAPKKPSNHHHHQDGHPPLVRSSSLVERFRSLHFYKHDAAFPETEYLHPVHDSPQLVRTPSLIERVRSFNFGFSNNSEQTIADTVVSVQPDDPPEHPTEQKLARTPSLLERLKSMNFSSIYRTDSIKAAGEVLAGEGDVPESKEDHDTGNLVRKSQSERSNEKPVKLPEKMKKSASERAMRRQVEEEEEEEEVDGRTPEPETARHGKGNETASFVEEETVDAKADDFINRFKQQLRLQRLNSFLRSKEMIRAN